MANLLRIGFWGFLAYKALEKATEEQSKKINYNNDKQIAQLDDYSLVNYNNAGQLTQFNPNALVNYNDQRQIPQSSGAIFSREEIAGIVAKIRSNLTFPQSTVTSPITQVRPTPDPQTVERAEWLKLIRHPCVIIILGGRDKGKSALGYKGLEYLEWTGIKLFVLGFPGDAGKLLPDSIGVIDSLEEAPINSAILVDETYLGYHARRTMAATSVQMSQTINLSRQRNQTLICVSQEGRQIDINIISQADMIIFKEPSPFQLEYERSELKKFAIKAKNIFETISGNKKRYSYVFAPGLEFEDLMEYSLPSFWTPQLSKVHATGGGVKPRAPKKTPLNERIEKAKQYKHQGLSLGQIAKLMGVSKPTIKNYLENYPYKA